MSSSTSRTGRTASPFDFDAAVVAPFRMRPGLRRLVEGAAQTTLARPGSRHQREKLAVLSAFADQALCAVDGFDARLALDALLRQAASEHGDALQWDGTRLRVPSLGVAVDAEGRIDRQGRGPFGHGDEAARCLDRLPSAWRIAALAGLALREDFAIVDAGTGLVPWIAAALPSHWAPERKVGHHFAAVHAPVADNDLIVSAAAPLMSLVTGAQRWERFVWMVTPNCRLHAHPDRVDHTPWRLDAGERVHDASGRDTVAAQAWFRTERQTFIPVSGCSQAVFTILVEVRPLVEVASEPLRAARLRDALASMSDAVLAYRGLQHAQAALVSWLDRRARGA